MAWSPSGMKLVTGCDDRRVRIVDAAAGAVEKEVPHDGFVHSVAWSPSGTKVATGSDDGLLRIMDAETGAVEIEVAHTDSAHCAVHCRR